MIMFSANLMRRTHTARLGRHDFCLGTGSTSSQGLKNTSTFIKLALVVDPLLSVSEFCCSCIFGLSLINSIHHIAVYITIVYLPGMSLKAGAAP